MKRRGGRTKLVITIDTEEDNWGKFQSTGSTVENIRRIPLLQAIFDEFDAVPTYLVTYPVATDPKSVSILKSILDRGRCEIGTHCHPWNTPPFEEECNERNSMICNLPEKLQYQKVESLHTAIKKNFAIEPVSFRAGRWGFNRVVAKNLIRLGYRIDTSVIPYTDWTVYSGPDYSAISPRPCHMKWEGAYNTDGNHTLMEIPASVGYLQKNFSMCNLVFESLRQAPLCKLRLIGLLHKLRLVNKVAFSPELADSRNMIQLAQRLGKNQYEVLNLFFHSPTLQAGLSPFVKTPGDEQRFLEAIRDVLIFARSSGIECVRLSEAPQHLQQSLASPVNIQ